MVRNVYQKLLVITRLCKRAHRVQVIVQPFQDVSVPLQTNREQRRSLFRPSRTLTRFSTLHSYFIVCYCCERMKLDAIAAHLTNVKFMGLLNLNRCGHCSCLCVMMAAHTSFLSF